MNYKKITAELIKEGYADEKGLVCHTYRKYTTTKSYGVIAKFTTFTSSFNLPSFMILSINNDRLNIAYAKAFGGFKKYFASFELKNLVFIDEKTVDGTVKLYQFQVISEDNLQTHCFYIIGLRWKKQVENLVEYIKNYHKSK